MMKVICIRKYGSIILCSVVFFYLGCIVTLNFVSLDCPNSGVTEYDNIINSKNEIGYGVLILSAPNNVEKRKAIRDTWLNVALRVFTTKENNSYRSNHPKASTNDQKTVLNHYFVIGTHNLNETTLKKLLSENRKTQDLLLLENVEENYHKLSRKVLYALKWFNDYYPKLKYLIKCDDDSFIRLDLIVQNLEYYGPDMISPQIDAYVSRKSNLPAHKGLYWGYFNGKAKVYMKGKWKEDEWFLCDHYLPYALGGGYVISRSIVDYIARNVEYLSHYNSEDVSMGVWTAALDGINRVHDVRFDTEWTSRGCDNHMLVRHKQKPSDMLQMYNNLVQTKGQRLCDTESYQRKFYMYDWNVLPSFCCK